MYLKEVLTALLDDTRFYLEKLNAEQFSRPLDLLSNASVGQHSRHFIEFLQCLLQQSAGGCICYDDRERNILIETDPRYTTQVIKQIIKDLEGMDMKQNLLLSLDYSTEKEGEKHQVTTTFERELVYNIEHLIHHLAIVKIGLLLIDPSTKIPKNFGVAPSTLRYRVTR